MSLSAGDKLDPYEIRAPIGAGGMGEVYRARDPRMGREVALKVSAEQFSRVGRNCAGGQQNQEHRAGYFDVPVEHPQFHFVATMTKMETSREPWTGETGIVDAAMLFRHVPDPMGPIYYIAGAPRDGGCDATDAAGCQSE